jgi:hypothetical protein
LIWDIRKNHVTGGVEHEFFVCSHKGCAVRPILSIGAGIDSENEIDIPFFLKKRP